VIKQYTVFAIPKLMQGESLMVAEIFIEMKLLNGPTTPQIKT
jgi:hypothetical protein